jgi:hypothetical protein
MLSWEDLNRHDLHGVIGIIDKLIDVTGMDFFSVEVAITKESGGDRFCLIDYVNDQCDMDYEAHPEWAVPEPFSVFACRQLADFVYREKHGIAPVPQRGLFLMG